MATFAAGDAVRVKAGVADPDYPDIPMGGWAGVVREVEAEPELVCLVRWTPETLAAMHPAYSRRCDRDGLEVEQTWLSGGDLAADDGGPLVIETPGELLPPPLDMDDELDRARFLLGLTSDDELPPVDEASLKKFHEELSRRLVFPFAAADANIEPILVRRILPPGEDAEIGLIAEVTRDTDEPEELPLIEVNVADGTVGRRDLEAYIAWAEEGLGGKYCPTGGGIRLPKLSLAVVLAAALVGAALAVLDGAWLAAQIGAGLLGVAGAFLGSGAESLFRRATRLPPGMAGGLMMGLAAGALFGGALGALAVCYVGAIPGAIVGSLLGRATGRGGFRLMMGCAWAGGLAYVATVDPAAAVWGAARGALGGVVFCAMAYFGFVGYMAWSLRR